MTSLEAWLVGKGPAVVDGESVSVSDEAGNPFTVSKKRDLTQTPGLSKKTNVVLLEPCFVTCPLQVKNICHIGLLFDSHLLP